MKFRLLFISLLLSASISYTQNFNGGLIGGLTATQISGDNLEGYDKVGLNIGGFVNLSLGRFTALELEMKYIQKGSKSVFDPFADTTASTRHIYRLQINYIELPVVFKYNLKGLSRHQSDSSYHLLNKLSVEVGLAYAEFLSYTEEDIATSVPLNSQPFKPYDFSAIAGFYYEFNDNLYLNFRRTGSILAVRPFISNPSPAQLTGRSIFQKLDKGQYNNVIELTLHYTIHKPKNKRTSE